MQGPGGLRSTWVNGVEAEALAGGVPGWDWMVGMAGIGILHTASGLQPEQARP